MVMDAALLVTGHTDEALVLTVSAMPTGKSAFHTALLPSHKVKVALAVHTYSIQLSVPATGVIRAAASLVTPCGLRKAKALATP